MPSAPDRESTFESLSLPVFYVFGAISLAIWWSPLTASLALALHDEQYTHILLILPISVALIFMDWKPPEPHIGLSVVLGTVLLIAAASLAFFMKWKAVALSPDERLSASMLALVVWWIAAFILCFGLRASRRALFPLCFLFWMVPFPEFVLNPVVNLLQQGSAAAAHLLFAAAGVPVEQHGVFVHTPGLTVEVARECSSIRSSSMLIVTTMVLAQLLLRSPWRKALIILLAIPLSVAKNGLRIFTIAMLTTRVDPSFLTGRLHREGGVIFFLIALAATFLLLWILRRGEKANHGVRTTRAVSTEL
ncbi:MAG: exosortase/archaeosortase family protein [Candidatus Sulfotelmatobacter sp.]